MAGAGLDRASRGAKAGMALTFPALIVLALTMLYPIGRTVWLSLNSDKIALRGGVDFVGLANYLKIIRNPDFAGGAGSDARLPRGELRVEAVVGLTVALALHRGLAGAKTIPRHRQSAAHGRARRRRAGLAVHVRRRLWLDRHDRHYFGGHGPQWFANVWLARAAVLIANLWLALPFDILVLLAGLAALPTEPLEAARVDGASPWQALTHITLPLLKPVIAIIVVIRLADAFRIFDVVYILTGSGPANRTDVLSTFIYRRMFTVFDFAGGAAGSILLVIVTSLASLIAVLALRDRAAAA